MTDLIDAHSRSTLSDEEVWPWPVSGPDTGGWLSGREIQVFGSGVSGRQLESVQRRPSARRPAARALEPLLSLTDDWDGHGAIAPSIDALKITSTFLRSLSGAAQVPDVMASVSGGVLIEWEAAEVDLILEVESHGSVNVHVRKGDTEEEGPLAAHRVAVSEALSFFASGAH